MAKSLLQAHRRAHSFLRTQLFSKDRRPSPPTQRSQPPSNSLPGLPAEIKQHIFLSLPDVPSLVALISTCSSLYYSFLSYESSNLVQVLSNQITPSLLPNALVTFEFSEVPPGTEQTADSHGMLYTKGETPFPTLTLRNALAISKMHDHIQFFANRFASYALSHHPMSGEPWANLTPLSPSESHRIRSTLYRFEFYCNLFTFRRKCIGNSTEVFATHFPKFAPWENEQFAYICDFLINTVSNALNNVAYPWAPYKVHLGKDGSGLNAECCLPRGLRFLHRLVLAKTYKERNRILSTKPPTYIDYPPKCDSLSHTPLSGLSVEEQRRLIGIPVIEDGDTGPESPWLWAHAHCFSANRCYGAYGDEYLREWGYVMWDAVRLGGGFSIPVLAPSFGSRISPNVNTTSTTRDVVVSSVMDTNVTVLTRNRRA